MCPINCHCPKCTSLYLGHWKIHIVLLGHYWEYHRSLKNVPNTTMLFDYQIEREKLHGTVFVFLLLDLGLQFARRRHPTPFQIINGGMI